MKYNFEINKSKKIYATKLRDEHRNIWHIVNEFSGKGSINSGMFQLGQTFDNVHTFVEAICDKFATSFWPKDTESINDFMEDIKPIEATNNLNCDINVDKVTEMLKNLD